MDIENRMVIPEVGGGEWGNRQRDQKVQISSYKMNTSLGSTVQHGEYS